MKSPYKGLARYDDSELDALFFFGRERDVEVIAANLLAARLTVLYGPTGVGKSSVLRAGVVRSLRAGPSPRAIVVFDQWSGAPADALAAAVAEAAGVAVRASLAETLADAGAALEGELYLVLDQLEEYFVYHRDAGGTPFMNGLAEALTRSDVRANVLLCLREDALAKLDVLKTRVPGLFSNYLRLDHLDRVAARAAVVGPIERWNELFAGDDPVELEPQLVEAILDQVQVASATHGIEAPYLQLVLERLWQLERDAGSSTLRLETLERVGGAARIVGDHLRRGLRELSRADEEIAAALFRQLVTPSGTKIAHAAPDLARYAGVGEETVRRVLEELVHRRIVRPVADDRYEIFHDVLAPAVRGWCAGQDARRAEARRRRATIVAAASLLALVAVAAVAVYALTLRSQAQDRARAARASALTARALLLQSSSPGTALALAYQASLLEPGPQTEDVLRSSLIASRLRRALRVGGPVRAVAWVGAGRVAVGTTRGRLVLWLTGHGAGPSLALRGPVTKLVPLPEPGTVVAVAGGEAVGWDAVRGRVLFRLGGAVSADATPTLLATAGRTGVTVRSLPGNAVLRTLPVEGARQVVLSPDGRRAAVVRVAADRTVTASLWDTAAGRLIAPLPGYGIRDVAFAPDGSVVATASANGTVSLFRGETGAPLRVLDDGGDGIEAVTFSPRGDLLATASDDGGVRVWRLADGSRWFYFLGHGGLVDDVVFSPDGDYLASTSFDGTARIWSMSGMEAGRLAAVLAGARGAVVAAAFAPGGHSLVTGGDDGVARLWEPRVEPQLAVVERPGAPVAAARSLGAGGYAAVVGRRLRVWTAEGAATRRLDGRVFALGDGELAVASGRSVVVTDVVSGRVRARLNLAAPATALAFAPGDGRLAALAARRVLTIDLASRRIASRFEVPPATVRVALTRDGTIVATGARTGVVRVWSAGGAALHVLRLHRREVMDLRFSPDGARLVTASQGGRANAAIWDVRTGKRVADLVGQFGTITAASFSPDGRWIVTAGPVSAVLWSAETGRLLFYVRLPGERVDAHDLLTDAEWAPQGATVVTADDGGYVRAYRCVVCGPLPSLQSLAARRLAARFGG